MCQRADSILTATLLVIFFSLPVQEVGAMSLFQHHHNGGATQPSVSGNVQKPSSTSNVEKSSNLQSIDAQPYITPVPEPSTVVLLGSGVVALGLWRWKKKQ